MVVTGEGAITERLIVPEFVLNLGPQDIRGRGRVLPEAFDVAFQWISLARQHGLIGMQRKTPYGVVDLRFRESSLRDCATGTATDYSLGVELDGVALGSFFAFGPTYNKLPGAVTAFHYDQGQGLRGFDGDEVQIIAGIMQRDARWPLNPENPMSEDGCKLLVGAHMLIGKDI
jgi:hypothetical protein